MYRLRTFGGLGLERGGAPLEDALVHRKSLALLALVDRHGQLGREPLMTFLWPESPTDRARGSLKQAVHLLRRRLDAPDLLLGTAELRLNPDRIRSDVGEFLEALERGNPRAAVELYRGPFLDGVHLDGTGEFERWAEVERDTLARRHQDALESLAREAGDAGRSGEAVRWWRRVQNADPLSTRIALELVDALAGAGDRAGALRHARVHEVLLQEELGLPPHPSLVERVVRLRDGGGPAGPAGGASPPDESRPAVPTSGETAPIPPTAPPGPRPAVQSARQHALRPASLAGFLAVLALAGGAALGAAALLHLLPAGSGAGAAGGGTGVLAGMPEGAPDRPAEAAAVTSIAVLPFMDMSPGGDQEHWADGIAEEILHTLARIPEIRVPARTSSFSFKGQNRPIGEIARELGVDHVLEGSIRTSGDRLRITAQLIDARVDRHLWSATFDPGPEDVFQVQTEIARTVAEALRVELALPQGAPGHPSPPSGLAHELYLRGLFHWNRRSAPDLMLAVRHFEEAIAIEPGYARAWAGLALVHAVIPITFVPPIPIPEARSRMEEAAGRALALDPTLAEVHAALGLGYHYSWRWEDAERAYLRALELDSRSSTAHQWYAEHLAKTGRPSQALAAVERAMELDPLSLVARNDLGLVHLLNREFDGARAAWESLLATDPTFVIPHFFLHRLDLLEGNLAGAEEWGRRWAALSGAATVEEISLLTRAVADRALRPGALALLEAWESGPAPRWHDLAFYRTWLGDLEGAIRMLERGVEEGAPMMVQVGAAPWFDPLRGEADFQALVARVMSGSAPGAGPGGPAGASLQGG